MRPLRVCLIASSRFPVAEPFVGGLEAHTHSLARALSDRGHAVSLFAAHGSDSFADAENLDIQDDFRSTRTARQDIAAPPERWMEEHHAYLGLCLGLAATGRRRFDVIHNNSLHHLPVAMSAAIDLPMVTTLHTPPTPWLESALRFASPHSTFLAVSEYTAAQWASSVSARVVHNGVDTERWMPGPGGDAAIWFGRIVPEKAPHVAIAAARAAGMRLHIAGPILDGDYYATRIAPELDDRIRYIGHLDSAALAREVGSSAVTFVTPDWDEPYGLVAAESMATGTPVAAIARGGVPELITTESGRLAAPGDIEGLARAALEAARLSRKRTRAHALRNCSIETMVDGYERAYSSVAAEARAS